MYSFASDSFCSQKDIGPNLGSATLLSMASDKLLNLSALIFLSPKCRFFAPPAKTPSVQHYACEIHPYCHMQL